MSDLAPPGPQRLFIVEPIPTSTVKVVAANGLTVCRCGDLAAAVLTAGAIARNRHEAVWLIAADHWTARLDIEGEHITATGSLRSPVDAIRRVLIQLPPKEEQP